VQWQKRCMADLPASTWINWSIGRVVLTWLYWGMFLAHSHPSVGVALSGLFNYPDYLGTNNLGLTFGRLRPVHVNGVIFGAFSTLFIGECYYLCRACCGVRVVRGEWGVALAWVWSLSSWPAHLAAFRLQSTGSKAWRAPAGLPKFLSLS